MHSAKFICFEGVGGAGKTTQTALLKAAFNGLGKNVYVTKAFEGQRRKDAEQFMRSLSPNLDPIGTMFLFQTLHSVQRVEAAEALNNHDVVIADRWRETFFAYHLNFGPMAKEPKSYAEIMDKLAFGQLEPDITILLDIPADLAKRRFEQREQGNQKLGQYDLGFFERTVNHYKTAAHKRNWAIVDAEQSVEKVHSQVRTIHSLSSEDCPY